MSTAPTDAGPGPGAEAAVGPAPKSPWRWSFYLPGVVAVLWGFYGLVTDDQGPDLRPWVVFTAALVIGHDFLIAPLAVAVGWAVARAVQGRRRGGTAHPGRFTGVARAPVQVGLAGSAVYLLAGLPLISGRGVGTDVPSALPYDYAARVAILCAVWWAAMAVWLAVRVLLRTRRTAT